MHESKVAHCTEPIVVRARPIVMHRDGLRFRPVLESRSEAVIRDEVDRIDVLDFADAVEHPVEHRPAADRQQMLGYVVGQRAQASRVAGGEDQGFQ